MADRPTKTENGMQFPAEAYAYVPDPERPSTWKLRLWEDPEKQETARQVGMAIAALGPGGFRGNRVQIPPEDLPAVKERIRRAWKKVHPDADPEEMPAVIRESQPAPAAGGKDASQDGAQRLLEYTTNRGLTLRVDRQRSMILGVKVLGLESQNGRRYLPQALLEAKHLYEGRPVNVDHQDAGRRSYRDRIGRLLNVRMEANGLYGDLLVNPKHPLAEQLLWDAENCPENVGLSHDAQGRTRMEGGRLIVESIQQVRSVDLVAEPATTRSLYEDRSTGAVAEPAADANVEPAAAPDSNPTEPAEEPPEDGEDVDRLPDEAFALVLPGGVKIGNRTWPLHKRYFPIHTPQAVRRSLERIAANRKLAKEHLALARQRALDAARKFGLDVSDVTGTKEGVMDLENLTLEQLKQARPDLVAQIQAAGEAQAERIRLKEERDRLAAELDALRRKEQLAQELQQAGLSPQDVPQSLMEALQQADDARRKAMLEDLRRLIRPSTVLSSRPLGGLPGSFEDRVRMWK